MSSRFLTANSSINCDMNAATETGNQNLLCCSASAFGRVILIPCRLAHQVHSAVSSSANILFHIFSRVTSVCAVHRLLVQLNDERSGTSASSGFAADDSKKQNSGLRTQIGITMTFSRFHCEPAALLGS
jgi:hypothetical protein